MAVLILAISLAAPSGPAEAVLARLKTYDIVRVEADVTPTAAGLAVQARLTLRLLRPGPHRLLVSGRFRGLEIWMGRRRIPAQLGLLGSATPEVFENLVRRFAPRGAAVPTLLTLRPNLRQGRTATFLLRYTWQPDGGWGCARAGAVDTQMDGLWLPGMLRERFESVLRIHAATKGSGELAVLAPGRLRDGAFHARDSQVVPIVVGRFAHRVRDGRFTVWLPDGIDADPRALLADLKSVHEKLAARFGPACTDDDKSPFTLVIDRALRPAPSYCASTFAVVRRHALPGAVGRARWIQHLAHEVSHRWWGHKVATPLLGRGGTWLREGLAEWSGLSIAGEIVGADAERRIGRALFRAYLRQADLRRRGDAIVANEATLENATYLDRTAVPYWRGALVFRLLDHRDRKGFRRALRAWAQRGHGDLGEFSRLLPKTLRPLVNYYVSGASLPDLALVRDGRRCRVSCSDPAWPRSPIPVLADGELVQFMPDQWFEARSVRVDPERIWLDPVVSNNSG